VLISRDGDLLDNLWTGLGALEKYQAKYSRWGRRRTKKAGNDYQGIERDESVLQNDISNLGTVGVGMLVWRSLLALHGHITKSDCWSMPFSFVLDSSYLHFLMLFHDASH
jgi:hypothetical protein